MWNWQTREFPKNFFGNSKKSVRTFKLRTEPYFLSHAERGKTFWIREFLAGMRLCRACGATPFRLPIPIFNFGGGYRIRTCDTGKGILAFQASALDHYANPPFCTGLRFVTVLALLRSDKTGTSNRTRPLCDASAREKI